MSDVATTVPAQMRDGVELHTVYTLPGVATAGWQGIDTRDRTCGDQCGSCPDFVNPATATHHVCASSAFRDCTTQTLGLNN